MPEYRRGPSIDAGRPPIDKISDSIINRPISAEELLTFVASKIQELTDTEYCKDRIAKIIAKAIYNLNLKLDNLNTSNPDFRECLSEVKTTFIDELTTEINLLGIPIIKADLVRRKAQKATRDKAAVAYVEDSEDRKEIETVTSKEVADSIQSELNQYIWNFHRNSRSSYAANSILTQLLNHVEASKREKMLRIRDISNSIFQIAFNLANQLNCPDLTRSLNREEIIQRISSPATIEFCIELQSSTCHPKEIKSQLTNYIIKEIIDILGLSQSDEYSSVFSQLYSPLFSDDIEAVVERVIQFYKIKSDLDQFMRAFFEYSEEVDSIDVKNIWALRYAEIIEIIRQAERNRKMYGNAKDEYIPIDVNSMAGIPPSDTADVRYLANGFRIERRNLKELVLASSLETIASLINDSPNPKVRERAKTIHENIRYALYEEPGEVPSVFLEVVNFMDENSKTPTLTASEIKSLFGEVNSEKVEEDPSDFALRTVLNSAESFYQETCTKLADYGISLPPLNFSDFDEILRKIRSTVIKSEADFLLVRDAIATLGIIHTTLTVRAKYSRNLAEEATNSIIKRLATSHHDSFTFNKEEGCFDFNRFPGFKLYIAEAKTIESVIRKMIAKGYTNDGLDSSILERVVKDHCRFTVVVPDEYFLINEEQCNSELDIFDKEIAVLGLFKAVIEQLVPILGTEFYPERFKFALGAKDKVSRYSTGKRMSVQASCDVRVLRLKTENGNVIGAKVDTVPTEIALVPQSQWLSKNSNAKALREERQIYERNNFNGVVMNLGLQRKYTDYFDGIASRAASEAVIDGVFAPEIERKMIAINAHANSIMSRVPGAVVADSGTETAKYFIFLHNMLTGPDADMLYEHMRKNCIRNANYRVTYINIAQKLRQIANIMNQQLSDKRRRLPSELDKTLVNNLTHIAERMDAISGIQYS